MMFRRTDSGLSNKAMFFDVNFIVYTEGKPGQANEIDKIFWEFLLKHFTASKITFKVEQKGSKTEFQAIRKSIFDGSINNSIACADSDYDRYDGTHLDHPLLLYTRGYSWENDICSTGIVNRAMKVLIPDDKKHEDCINLYVRNLHSQRNTLSIIGRLDIFLQIAGAPLQNKKAVGSLISDKKGIPKFCRTKSLSAYRKSLHELSCKKKVIDKKEMREKMLCVNFDFYRDFHGKTIIHFTLKTITFLLKKSGFLTSNMDNTILTSAMLRLFKESVEGNLDNEIVEYYRGTIGRIITYQTTNAGTN